MLDPQTATSIAGAIAFVLYLYQLYKTDKVKDQLRQAREAHKTGMETANGYLAEKTQMLTTEYMAKKKLAELLEATHDEATGAKIKMLELNDALIASRAEAAQAQDDVKTLDEERMRLHKELDEANEHCAASMVQLTEATEENAALKALLESGATVSVKTAKKVAKKSKKKVR